MEIKHTPLGLLIYAAMAVWLLALVCDCLPWKKLPRILFFAGFLLTGAAFVHRWQNVGHIPMQNLLEVFLTLSLLIFPLSAFCRRFLNIFDHRFDRLLGLVLLFPAGFIFHAEPQPLPPALQCWLFAPHVAVYVLAYILLAKAASQAFRCLRRPAPSPAEIDPERSAYRLVCMGFPLLTLGLLLGSVWGHLAWGDYWGWDPKELWSLITWLLYIGYFHFRFMFGRTFPRLNALWILLGFLAIILTLLWVNLASRFSGLHSYAS